MAFSRQTVIITVLLLVGAYFIFSYNFQLIYTPKAIKLTTPVIVTQPDKKPQSCWSMYLSTIKRERIRFIPGKTVMMDPKSVAMVCDLLKPHMSVLEWGSGGSTLFFSKFVKEWYSLEHDGSWGSTMKNYTRNIATVHLDVIPVHWTTTTHDGDYETFRTYVERPKTYGKRFDVIIVDGRARVHCARSVLRNGLLATRDSRVIIHDWQRAKFKTVLDVFDIDAEETTESRHLAVLKPKLTDIGVYPPPHNVFPMVQRLIYIAANDAECGSRFTDVIQPQHFDKDRVKCIVNDSPNSRLRGHVTALKYALKYYPGDNVVLLDGQISFVNRQPQLEQQFWYLWEHTKIAKAWSLVVMTGIPEASKTLDSAQKGVVLLKAVSVKTLPFNGYAVHHRHIEQLSGMFDKHAQKANNTVINLPRQWYAFVKPILQVKT